MPRQRLDHRRIEGFMVTNGIFNDHAHRDGDDLLVILPLIGAIFTYFKYVMTKHECDFPAYFAHYSSLIVALPCHISRNGNRGRQMSFHRVMTIFMLQNIAAMVEYRRAATASIISVFCLQDVNVDDEYASKIMRIIGTEAISATLSLAGGRFPAPRGPACR